MIVISASRRTDIPAYYSGWFMERIRAGFCLVPHPFNRRKISFVPLIPEKTAAIIFWTKDPTPLLSRLPELDDLGFRYLFLFTLNDYPSPLEPMVPPLEKRIEAFQRLAEMIGPRRMAWRYDPIIISNRTDWDWHRQTFIRLSRELSGASEKAVTSIVSWYAKTRRRLGPLAGEGFQFDQEAADRPEMRELLADMAQQAKKTGFTLSICAESRDFSDLGVAPARCIDGEWLAELWGLEGPFKKDPGQRKACGCTVSKDIGVSDTCRHDCAYCYATVSTKAAQKNHEAHNMHSPMLAGEADASGDYDLSEQLSLFKY